MTAREKAQKGVELLKEAVVEFLEARAEGATVAEMDEELGVRDSDAKGQQKDHVLWGIRNLLRTEGTLETEKKAGGSLHRLKR